MACDKVDAYCCSSKAIEIHLSDYHNIFLLDTRKQQLYLYVLKHLLSNSSRKVWIWVETVYGICKSLLTWYNLRSCSTASIRLEKMHDANTIVCCLHQTPQTLILCRKQNSLGLHWIWPSSIRNIKEYLQSWSMALQMSFRLMSFSSPRYFENRYCERIRTYYPCTESSNIIFSSIYFA